jgi:16S rRNA (uracil1498-N3)-methyltransferase
VHARRDQSDSHRTAHRFFCEQVRTGTMRLPPAEARHAIASLRLSVGSRIVLFDGSGRQWPARIEAIADRGRDVRLTVDDPVELAREPAVAVTVATGVPKGRRWHWLLEKCTELGAAGIVALQCERSVARPAADRTEAWRRVCIEAAKQCGRNRLPAVGGPVSPPEAIAEAGAELVLIGTAQTGQSLAALAAGPSRPKRVLLLVGPEGGFSGAEHRAACQVGAVPVLLGPTRLRTETAAVGLLAATIALWG